MTKSKLSKRGGTRRKTRGGKKSIRRNKRGNRKTRHLGKRGKRRTIRRNKRGGYNAIRRAHGRFKGKLGCNPPFIKRASAAGLFEQEKAIIKLDPLTF